MLKKITFFFKETLWLLQEDKLNIVQSHSLKYLRILSLAIKGFTKDICRLRASALTLYTLLSIVPIIAMLFGIAKGFGFEKLLKKQILEYVPQQDSMVQQLIQFSENLLANTQGGMVAGIGVIILFWTVIEVIGNMEESFNHIWKIKQARTLTEKLSDYLSLMFLAPVLLIAANSINVYVTTQITSIIQSHHLPSFGTTAVLHLLSYSPLFIMITLFSIMFIFIPNQKIEMKAGIIAGIITGILYQNLQSAYLDLQIGVSTYNAIYGSFTALPLFIIWLQIGWLIVLLGCEISFFIQHYEIYKHNQTFSTLSFKFKKLIALRIMILIVKRFIKAEQALNIVEIAMKLILPIAVVRSSLTSLIKCDLIVELKPQAENESLFQPAKDVNHLTVYDVMDVLEKQGENHLSNMDNFVKLSEINQIFDEKIKASPENQLLKEL